MEVEREGLKLEDDPKTLSPPLVDPAWQCGTVVVVRGFVPGAMLDVSVDGTEVVSGAPGGHPLPDGALITLPAALVADQEVRARQQFDLAVSDWSPPVFARDHTKEYPAGPPRPHINPAPLHECGVRTGVANLLVGSEVWLTADGTEVGRVAGSKEHQGVNVSPPYKTGQ